MALSTGYYGNAGLLLNPDGSVAQVVLTSPNGTPTVVGASEVGSLVSQGWTRPTETQLGQVMSTITTTNPTFYGGGTTPSGSGSSGSQPPSTASTPAPGSRAQLQAVLDGYGLGSLTGWAYGLLTQGYSIEYILAEMRNRPEFRERFPAIFERQRLGKTPLSPAEYIELERSYDTVMHAAGITGLFDRRKLYTSWLVGDVAPTEAKNRADMAFAAAQAEPLEVRQELTRLFGIGAGAAAVAYFLDPQGALPKLQTYLREAQVGGASLRSTYGLLSRDELDRLGALGVSGDEAQGTFDELARRRELYQALPGEAGETITREQQLAAGFEGNAQAQQAMERAASRRKAAFAGGAQYRRDRTGVVGLGDTSR